MHVAFLTASAINCTQVLRSVTHL